MSVYEDTLRRFCRRGKVAVYMCFLLSLSFLFVLFLLWGDILRCIVVVGISSPL